MKKFIIVLVALVVIAYSSYYFIKTASEDAVVEEAETNGVTSVEKTETTPTVVTPEPTAQETQENKPETIIGSSVEERPITAYHYGTGEKEILFVGGIHGGYSWNTVLVAYELMDYLEENQESIPENITVTVIPVLNPDGLSKVIDPAIRFTKSDVSASQETLVSGRFNANDVDLNRNFDCDWQSAGTWQNKTVSGGSKAFSEPESQSFRDYVEANDFAAVVVWYSAAGGVFSSNCHNGILPETTEITNIYAKASGYTAYEDFDFYTITGDMVNWLAKNSIPAISVLLTTHSDVEWDKNRAGVEALLKYYAE